MIARGKNLPESKVCEANAVIGECALRTGSYALAEEAFRNMMKFRKDAFPVNQLATALKKQGKDKEATELFRQVADRFAMSERAEDRFETVRALLALSGSPESVERSRAFGMLETLLEDDPDHPEYRFNTHSFWPEIPAFSGRGAFPALNRMQPCCSSSLPTPIRNGRNTAWRW